MSGAADLTERVTFQQRGLDANGDRLGDWNSDGDGFTVRAGITWLRRGEAVLEDRLQGQSPAVIKVWSSARTRAVSSAWRALDLRTGRALNLLSPGEPSKAEPLFLEFLASADGKDV